jgi:hypothetical protein
MKKCNLIEKSDIGISYKKSLQSTRMVTMLALSLTTVIPIFLQLSPLVKEKFRFPSGEPSLVKRTK